MCKIGIVKSKILKKNVNSVRRIKVVTIAVSLNGCL